METQAALAISESLGFNLVQHKDMKLWMVIFHDITMYITPKDFKKFNDQTYTQFLVEMTSAYGNYIQQAGPPTIH